MEISHILMWRTIIKKEEQAIIVLLDCNAKAEKAVCKLTAN